MKSWPKSGSQSVHLEHRLTKCFIPQSLTNRVKGVFFKKNSCKLILKNISCAILREGIVYTM